MKKILIFFLVMLGLLSGVNATTLYNVTGNDNAYSIGYSTNSGHKEGQTITGNGEELNFITFNYYKAGTPTMDINVSLIAGACAEGQTKLSTGKVYASQVTGTSIGTSNSVKIQMTPYTLLNGTTYCIILEKSDGSTSTTNQYSVVVNTLTNQYSSGTWYRKDSAWTTQNYDFFGYIQTNMCLTLSFSSISTINSIYNLSTIQVNTSVLNTSTNGNVNQTYYLYYNNGTLINSTQYATNNVNGTADIVGLTDNTYKIYFYAKNNETNVTSSNYTFTIDTTAPTISNNINSTYYLYNISGFNSSCSDINMNYCNISINSQNIRLNTTSFNFTTNGNMSYTITAVDLAGNTITTSGVTLINPTQYLRPYDNLRSIYLTNYYIDGVLYSDYYNFSLFSFGYGNHSVNFSKEGYTNTTFDFSLNTTSALNSTFNVTPITFTLKAYDINNPTNQLYFNLTISNATNSTYYLNQHNFSKYYNETLTGDLTLIVESSGFDLVKLYTAFSPYTAVSQIVYLNNLSVPVIYRVLDISLQQPIEDVVLNVYSQINGSQTFIGQAKTDSQGFTYFNQDTSRDYYITFTKSGYVTQQINSLPGVVEYTVLMPEDGADAGFIFNGLSYKFSPTAGTITDLPFNGSVTVIDEDSLISSLIFTISGTNYTNSTSDITSPNGGVYTLYVNNASTQYLFNLTIVREGQTYTFTKTYNYLQESNETTTLINVAQQLNSDQYNGEKIFIIMFIYIGFMALGAFFSPTLGVMFGIFPLMLFAFVGWIPDGVAILLGFFNVLGALYFRG